MEPTRRPNLFCRCGLMVFETDDLPIYRCMVVSRRHVPVRAPSWGPGSSLSTWSGPITG